MVEDGGHSIKTYKVSKKDIEVFKKTLGIGDEVGVESTGNTHYFVGEIENRVKIVRVINPTQFKVISSSIKNTDNNAAITIAKYLSKGLIPEVRMKSKEEMQLGSLINTRDKLVKLRTVLKNKVHNILNANGIVTEREIMSSQKGLEDILKTRGIDKASEFELSIIIEQIKSLNSSIEKIDTEITERGQKLKGYDNLKSIKGIGSLSATILLNTIGNIKDFDNEKKLAAYLGIVPRVHQSNEMSQYGRITKMGNKIARTALVQSTLIAIRYNSYLRKFYDTLKAKKGSGKAIVATSRKLLTIVYKTLKNDWIFEDFTTFKHIKLSDMCLTV
jgi:transposase